jgi:hypothetical protein
MAMAGNQPSKLPRTRDPATVVAQVEGAPGRIQFTDASAEALLADGLSRALALELDDRAVLVKANPRRRVFELVLPGGPVFVKRYTVTGWRGRMQTLLSATPAHRALRAARFAQARGVPTVEIVARVTAPSRWRTRSVLIVSRAWTSAGSLADAVHALDAIADPAARRAQSNRLCEALADLFASAHAAGFLHRDAHPGNLLVRTAPGGEYEFTFLDLEAARCGRPVDAAAAARCLAGLGQWFTGRASRSTALRFLKRYAQRRGQWQNPKAFRAFAAQVAQARSRHAHRLYRKRDRRAGRRNAYYDRQTADDGAKVWATRRLRSSCLFPHAPTGELFPGSAIGATGSSSAQPLTETFFAEGWGDAVAWFLLGGPGRRRYRGACALMHRDIPVAMPLGCRQTGGHGWVAQSAWRGLRPRGSVPLLTALRIADPRRRRDLLAQLGALLADTLARGAVVTNGQPARLAVSAGGRIFWTQVTVLTVRTCASPAARRWMLAELAERLPRGSFAMSATDRARVVRAFCRRMGPAREPGGWRSLWRDITRDRSG